MAGASRALCVLPVVLLALTSSPLQAADDETAGPARAVLRQYCYKCHGQGGEAKGGFGYVLDRARLVASGKIVPGKPDESELFQRITEGEMPPKKTPRPRAEEVALLRRWIEAGAPARAGPARPFIDAAALHRLIRDDLRLVPRRHRRFVRYLTFTHLHNAGRPAEELKTCAEALSKLINSLSWHPRITPPHAVDPDRTIFRIDLRHYKWDARAWDRVVALYPYRLPYSGADARACADDIGRETFHLRGDWFIATASRGELYYDLLEMPATDRALERLLQVDVARNLREETALRAGFNGSGVSKNNRIIERHDAGYGAYWRSYDFSANTDRQNIFEHPLGPAAGKTSFSHAGGEVIFHLPNGMQGYLLVDGNGQRVEKAPVEIVSDPKRPDRAVEAGVSCMSCHARGLIPKDDQIRAHVEKNPTAFPREVADTVRALYPPAEKMRALMERDTKRHLQALKDAGVTAPDPDPVMAVTLRFEDVLDLKSAAAEVGLPAEAFARRVSATPQLKRLLGPLQARGGTVQRETFEESFDRIARELRAGADTVVGKVEKAADPFAGHTGAVQCVAVSPDGRLAASGSDDETVRVWEVPSGKQVHVLTGHTGAVRCVAFSPDGKRLLSGGADRTVRLWNVESGKELKRMAGHVEAIRTVAFSPKGDEAVSAAKDRVRVWDLGSGEERRNGIPGATCACFAPNGRRILVGGADGSLSLWDLKRDRLIAQWAAHRRGVYAVAFSTDGRHIVSGGEDAAARVWKASNGQAVHALEGHASAVLHVAFSADGRRVFSGGGQNETKDRFLRVWDRKDGKQVEARGGEARVWCVAFAPNGSFALTGGSEKRLRLWPLTTKP